MSSGRNELVGSRWPYVDRARQLPRPPLLRLPLPRWTAHWRGVAAVAAFDLVAFPVLFSAGTRLTSASHAAMILALLPVATGGLAFALDASCEFSEIRFFLNLRAMLRC
jgi:drug/metabolite transporter (DMT)-like permease